ncbi:MAG: hypothetical protein R3F20_11945 [Planctomycetota bacterium]
MTKALRTPPTPAAATTPLAIRPALRVLAVCHRFSLEWMRGGGD